MDSRIFAMREAVENVAADDFSSRIWSMDNRKLFNHARKNLSEDTKLF